MLSFTYADFTDADTLNFVGATYTPPDGALRLTAAAAGLTGAAWHDEQQYVALDFETTYQFRLHEGSDGGDSSSQSGI